LSSSDHTPYTNGMSSRPDTHFMLRFPDTYHWTVHYSLTGFLPAGSHDVAETLLKATQP